MSSVRCKFYLQGSCFYGSSCRFLHDQPHRSNDHHDYENQSRSKRNVSKRYDTDNSRDYNGYNEYGKNYESDSRNTNYNYKKNYNSRNDYYNQRNDYKEDYDSSNHYDNQAQRQRNVKNYYKEEDNSQGGNYNYESNKVHTSSNRYKNSDDQKHNHGGHHVKDIVKDKENVLMYYGNEIKAYQRHIKQLSMSNIWPFTCFHPIGHSYPIQPIGCLNLIEISFEEIRCDYYLTKYISADPSLIHKRTVDGLLLKARKQKEDILTFDNRVQNDVISTFKKCEESKVSKFENVIQMDHNSYWDMSIRSLKAPEDKKSELETFSFVSKKNDKITKNEPQLKILMQTEVYGKLDNEAFAQDHFTDFIPIMPPPKNDPL